MNEQWYSNHKRNTIKESNDTQIIIKKNKKYHKRERKIVANLQLKVIRFYMWKILVQ